MKRCQQPYILSIFLAILSPIYAQSFGENFGGIASPFAKNGACKPIPDTLKLCRNISYPVMRLPNLLDHETMEEVHQQANSWVPLLPKNCHSDLKLFLCTLFAPICIPDIPAPIYPCRSLCEQVRDACTPVMEQAGFPWPINLKCEQYPQNDMCVKSQCKPPCVGTGTAPNTSIPALLNTTTDTSTPPPKKPTCSPCDNALDTETVLDHYCASEFVLKVKIRSFKKTRRDIKLVTERRRRIVYKQGPLRKKDLRKLTLVIRGGANCPCPQLSTSGKSKKKKKDFYLIMGRKLDRKLLVTVLHRWPRKQKVLRRVSKKFTNNICS